MFYNPWKRIAALKQQLADAETAIARMNDIVEYERERTEQIVGDAIAAHYRRMQHENVAMRMQNEALMKAHIDMASTQPFISILSMKEKANG